MNHLPTNSSISLDLTEECNLACSYCFTWAKQHKRKVLPLELGKKIINYWLKNGKALDDRPRELSFWGGEPLLEWKLLQELVKYTNENKGDQQVVYGGTTNGVLYTPDKVEWCKENQSMMLVSLDGIEEVHDYSRKMRSGKGSWKIIDKNLREAMKIAPEQMIRSSLTVQSAPFFLDNVKYFIEDLGIQNFSFSPVFEDEWNEENLDILRDQFKQTISYIIDRKKNGDTITIKHFDDEAMIPKNTEMMMPNNPCGAGNHYSCWSVDGVNYPCHRFNKHELGYDERLSSAMAIGYLDKNDEYIKLNKDFKKEFEVFKDNPSDTCSSCDIFRKSVCSGGCYALNYDTTKDIHGIVKTQCDFNKLQRETGILYAEMLEKNNLPIHSNLSNSESCVCYNMCYMENSPFEIIHIDQKTDMTCTCYNANFNHVDTPYNSRTIKERRKEKEIILSALSKITPKDENGVVEKAFDMLNTLK